MERRKKKERKNRQNLIREIIEILSHTGTKIKSAYWYFKNERKIKCSYDNFKTFVKKNKLLEEAKTGVPHPLYETDPGKQLQVDWVESIKVKFGYV